MGSVSTRTSASAGEAAGMLAAFSLEHGRKPAPIHAEENLLRAFQATMIDDGVPLCWLVDVPVSHPDFAAVQQLVIERGFGGREDSLLFHPDESMSEQDRAAWLYRAESADSSIAADTPLSRVTFARQALKQDRPSHS